MKESTKRKDFDTWVSKAYPALVRYGRRYHRDASDLVNHVYLRVVKQDLEKVMRNPDGYFRKAMYIEATRGKFKREYTITQELLYDIPSERVTIDDALNREQLELFTDRLSWFDQTVFRLWLNGENISELSRESGIALETLHTSLHRTKKKIKDAFSKLRDKKPKT